MTELLGRRALVTGSAVRLGRAIALELAKAGADVVVHYHSHPEAAAEVVDLIHAMGRQAVAVQGDLSEARRRSQGL